MTTEFPSLELVFGQDKNGPFLVDAIFRIKSSDEKGSIWLIQNPPKGKYFRALCIVMLLAKYRGINISKPDEDIFFHDVVDRASWLKTLGMSFGKGVRDDFFAEYFKKIEFISANRGSTHNSSVKQKGGGALSTAIYRPQRLPLKNLFLSKLSKSRRAERVPLTRDELPEMAERLEKFELGKRDGWVPIVRDMVERFNRILPPTDMTHDKELAQNRIHGSSFVLWKDSWELFASVQEILRGETKKGDWYAICEDPNWLNGWRPIFDEALTLRKAKVKVAYRSPIAIENCKTVEALIRMANYQESSSNVVKDFQNALRMKKFNMKHWNTALAHSSGRVRAGFYEFFESHVPHPYSALLFVPTASKEAPERRWGAPFGAFCVVGLNTLYSGERNLLGLFLDRPSEMLDTYYNSITQFFERGPKDGYLNPVDWSQFKLNS